MANPRGRKGDMTVSKSERADHSTEFATGAVAVSIAYLAMTAKRQFTAEQSTRHARFEVKSAGLNKKTFTDDRIASKPCRGFAFSEGFVPTRNVEEAIKDSLLFEILGA